MEMVDVLLLWIVGFSALVSLIVENLVWLHESRKAWREADHSSATDDTESKSRAVVCLLGSVKASRDHEEGKIVGAADSETVKQLVCENFKRVVFQEIREEAEAENPVNYSSEKSGFCSGLIDVSRSVKGISNDGEREEEFFDDWEGIERTELEKIFGEALVFVSRKSNADQIDGDVKLHLYGLEKIALEGACRGSQPMAMKLSASAKWNAWQKLGNMSRELAMEKYVNILLKAIPGWKVEGTEAIKDAISSDD